MVRLSSAEFFAYESRRAGQCRLAEPEEGFDCEKDLHDEIFDECRHRGWIALHGSMAARTHRTEGEPDFVILAERGRLLLVECKSKSGKLSIAQRNLQAQARHLGHVVHEVRTVAEFIQIINGELLQ